MRVNSSCDNGLLIDLSRMKAIRVDAARAIVEARVGGPDTSLTRSASLWSSCLAVMLTRTWLLLMVPACRRHAPSCFR